MSEENEEQYISEELLSLEPTDEDISLYCQDLGIDRAKDPDLVWIAIEGFRAPLPPHWKYYRAKNDPDVTFFFNSKTGESINEHPLDHVFHELYLEEKRKKDAGLPYAHSKEELDKPIDYGQSSHHKKKRKKHTKKENTPQTEKPKENPDPEPEPDIEDIFELNSDSLSEPTPKSRTQTPVRNETFKMSTADSSPKQQSDTKKKINDEENQMKREIEEMRAQHERELNDMIAMHNAEMNRLERDFEARRSEKQNQLQSLEAQKAAVSKEHENEVERLREKNKEAIEALKKDLEEELKHVEEQNQKKLQEAREQGDRKIEEEMKAKEAALEDFKRENRKELAELKQAHREKVEAMRKKHEEKLKEIRAKASQHLSNERKKSTALQTMGSLSIQAPIRTDFDAVSKFDTLGRAELEHRRREYEEELANMIARQVSAIAEKKEEGERQLLEQQRYNTRAVEAARNECEMEIKRYREKVEREKKEIMKSIRHEALRNQTIDRRLIIQRLVSIKPQSSRSRVKLHRSTAKCVNVYDDVIENCALTRPQMIFQKKPSVKRRKRTGEVSPRTTESPRRIEIPEIETIAPSPVPTATQETVSKPNADDVFLERTGDEEHKVKLTMNKLHRDFDTNCEKLKTKMGGVFNDMNDECRDLRSFIQEQNKLLSRQALEFRQQAMEISRNLHASLNELETVHRSAVSTFSNVNADPPPSPPIYFAPQPPYQVVGFIPPGRSSVRRARV